MTLVDQISSLATRIGTEVKSKTPVIRFNKAVRADPKPYPVLYSWFGNVSDGTAPSTFNTGQAATAAPGAVAPTISSGRLIASGSGVRASYYRSPALGATVTRVGGRFSLRPGTATRTGGGTAAIAITAVAIDITSGVNTNMSCHFRTTSTAWAFSVWTQGVGEVVLDSGTYPTPLTVDSATEYEMQAWITGTSAIFELPNGQRRQVTDSRINTYAGQYAYFESYLPNGNTDDMAAFSHVWADTGTSIPEEPTAVHKSGPEDIYGYKALMDGAYLNTLTVGGTVVLLNGSPASGKVLISDAGGSVSWTDILTNKQITPRVSSASNTTSWTINSDTTDFATNTGLTGAVTINNPTGTPTQGQKLWIALTGTASRAITYGSAFEDSTAVRPTTTSGTARLDIGFIWNSVTSKWRCVAVA